ncbi:MAG: SMC-Scp complex subunit ScpB [Pseudomonadota bacterium]
MDESAIKPVLEAALLAAGRPLSVDELHATFRWGDRPDKKLIRKALAELAEDYTDRGIEIIEVASGFRVQVPVRFAENLESLHEERPPRYSRALLETLALIAYRQPITRGEIEDVRGVAVSPNIIRTLLEREWIRSVGHRDVPGRPEMFGTTKHFLDYFSLKKLDDLPDLSELTDIEALQVQLDLPSVEPKIVNEANPAAQQDDVAANDAEPEAPVSESANQPAAQGEDAEPSNTVVIVTDDAPAALASEADDAPEASDDAESDAALDDINAANR